MSERRIWWHWSPENDRPRGADGKRPRVFPWHGRAWLHWRGGNDSAYVEWSFGRFKFSLSFSHDEEGLHWCIQVPLVSLFFGIEATRLARHYKRGERELSLRVHDWAIWWTLWSTSTSWNSKTPRWRDGCFHIDNFLLGKARYSERPLEYRFVEVPMPERAYIGCARLEEATWSRARWFARRLIRCEIKMLDGEQVPVPGKGENSWDCGEDAIFGSTVPARNIAEAVGELTGSALRTRARHGGQQWRPETKAAAE